ncbi:hypothetical protein MFIFM68171_02724 [Madurella fahalii]|uniref:Clr5 domain-containing protein n=1 Tax=Madurella fahalii TaxID=1157608 RepID=A0ABQ0G441_9PEZI
MSFLCEPPVLPGSPGNRYGFSARLHCSNFGVLSSRPTIKEVPARADTSVSNPSSNLTPLPILEFSEFPQPLELPEYPDPSSLIAVSGLPKSLTAPSCGQVLTPIGKRPQARLVVPGNPADWEARKHIIQDLYMDRNLILNEVIDIMLREHQFKATARMYKGQFAKWGWTKYNKSGKPGSTKPTKAKTARKKCTEANVQGATICRQTPHLPQTTQAQFVRLLHFSGADREMQLTLGAYAALISHWSERETPWKAEFPGETLDGLDGQLHRSLQQKNSILQQVRASLEHFCGRRTKLGGEMLRHAFLEIEHALTEGLDIEAVWDCCLAVPQLVLSMGWTDMFSIFAGYLHQFTSIKLSNHPINKIAESLHKLSHHQDTAYCLLRMYVTRGWEIWIERVTAVRGQQDDLTVHLKRGYITLMNPEPKMTETLVPDFCQAVKQSLATRGTFATTSRMLELEHLLVRMYLPLFTPESATRANRMLTALVRRIEDNPRNKGLPVTEWHFLDRYLVFSANYFMASVAEYNGETAKAAVYRKKSLDTPKDLFWLQTALVTEQRLQLAGYHEEANEIMEERLKVQSQHNCTELRAWLTSS